MKTVILAGGLGSRLGEETAVRPKPMVEIGGRPIIWHIMKIYSAHGLNDFVICLGYKGYMIKEYFANYFLHMSDVTFDLADNSMTVHQNSAEPWRVTLVDTGAETQTGGRLKAVRRYLDEGEDFCFTYGDGVADVDIRALVAFHEAHGKQLTMTAVAPPGRFGAVETDGDRVVSFLEKPPGDGGRINGGFFVGHTSVLDLVEGPGAYWEREPMEALAAAGQLMAFRHDGFWAAMDTLRDKTVLEAHWAGGAAPWKVW
ncbi:MAG TPA: glucose-1-phosphate cytidylyltransferase [Caulobacteraceae bacterium]|jgi:glucose-1-phosphate cytidylyltransferase